MTGFAPSACASCSPRIDTPPVPWSSTKSPGCVRPRVTSAFHTVTPAQGRVAASSYDRYFGSFTRPFSSSVTYCDNMPSTPPPSALAMYSGCGRPSNHFGKKIAATRSPFLKRVTPGPVATTSPAPSESGTSVGGFGPGYWPSCT